MTPEREALAPCPWCSVGTIETVASFGEHGGIAAFCLACGARGPVKNNSADAARFWNALPRGATPTPAPSMDVAELVARAILASGHIQALVAAGKVLRFDEKGLEADSEVLVAELSRRAAARAASKEKP